MQSQRIVLTAHSPHVVAEERAQDGRRLRIMVVSLEVSPLLIDRVDMSSITHLNAAVDQRIASLRCLLGGR